MIYTLPSHPAKSFAQINEEDSQKLASYKGELVTSWIPIIAMGRLTRDLERACTRLARIEYEHYFHAGDKYSRTEYHFEVSDLNMYNHTRFAVSYGLNPRKNSMTWQICQRDTDCIAELECQYFPVRKGSNRFVDVQDLIQVLFQHIQNNVAFESVWDL